MQPHGVNGVQPMQNDSLGQEEPRYNTCIGQMAHECTHAIPPCRVSRGLGAPPDWDSSKNRDRIRRTKADRRWTSCHTMCLEAGKQVGGTY